MNRRHRGGFTIIEMLVTALIIGIMAGLVFSKRALPTAKDAAAVAQEFANELRFHLARAVESGGMMVVRASSGSGDYGESQYTIWRTDAADSSWIAPSGSETYLDGYFIFTTGVATRGPIGGPIGSAVPLSLFNCDAWRRCELGGDPTAIFYFGAKDDPDALAAVSITHNGNIRNWTYRLSNNTWY